MKKTEEVAPAPVPTIDLVYCGLEQSQDLFVGKPKMVFRLLGKGGKLGDRLLYQFKRDELKGLTPGAVYTFKSDNEGKNIAYAKGMRPTSYLDDSHSDMVATWVAQTRAIQRQVDAEARMEKEGSRNHLFEALDPIQKAYGRLRGPARAQMIADVVAHITKGG